MARVDDTMRLDRFLWFARVVKSRPIAQVLATSGHLRIDGRAVDRAHCPVRIGNVLTFAAGEHIRIVRVESLPVRRGPPAEAQACYSDLATRNDVPAASPVPIDDTPARA